MEHQKISYDRSAYESVDVRSLYWIIPHRSMETSTPEGIYSIFLSYTISSRAMSSLSMNIIPTVDAPGTTFLRSTELCSIILKHLRISSRLPSILRRSLENCTPKTWDGRVLAVYRSPMALTVDYAHRHRHCIESLRVIAGNISMNFVDFFNFFFFFLN